MVTERYLLELAVHVKLASEAILAAARNMVALRPDPAEETAAAWTRTMDDLAMMNIELGMMEQIVRSAAGGAIAADPKRLVAGRRRAQ